MRLGRVVVLSALTSLAALQARAVTPPPGEAVEMPGAAPKTDVWPKPVNEFLAGQYLQRADIVLTRRDWNASSWLIRWFTSSPFSHAALVFTGHDDAGIDKTFLIEAGADGVDLSKLDDHLNDKSSFIAVKRFKQNWFDPNTQSRVRGVLLNKIEGTYNYWALARIARTIWFGAHNTVQGKEKTIETYKEQNWTPPSEFICSGFVQVGFVETVIQFIRDKALPPTALNDVIFHQEAASRLPDAEGWGYLDPETAAETAEIFRQQNAAELESITPDDLAKSDKLEWLYVISGGMAYKVSSYDEVKAKVK